MESNDRLRPGVPVAARAASSTCAAIALLGALVLPLPSPAMAQQSGLIPFPEPDRAGDTSVEQTLAERRSIRDFRSDPLRPSQLGQLLWAAQGITEPMSAPEGWPWGEWGGGLRAAPSAGALYPLEVYVVVDAVEGLEPGVYHYVPEHHALERIGSADGRALASAALGQRPIAQAPAVLVLAAVYQRTAAKYGDRARRYVHMEAGAAAENVYLQAEALGLGTVFIGAFRDEAVRSTLGLPDHHAPLAILPVGQPDG
jgi:SagB-type dehydrogenase family enzyme